MNFIKKRKEISDTMASINNNIRIKKREINNIILDESMNTENVYLKNAIISLENLEDEKIKLRYELIKIDLLERIEFQNQILENIIIIEDIEENNDIYTEEAIKAGLNGYLVNEKYHFTIDKEYNIVFNDFISSEDLTENQLKQYIKQLQAFFGIINIGEI